MAKAEESVSAERHAAEKLGKLEHLEFMVARREIILAQTETIWKTQTAMFERERMDLCAEIDRLAGTIVGLDSSEPISLARAA